MDGVFKLFGILVAMTLAGAAAYVVIVFANAMVKRLEGRGGVDEALKADLDELRMRVEDGEQMKTRIAELEERLEFAERLLAQHRDVARLPGERDD
jgi:Tfp pilus assembly protein PilO